ncbi:MAG: hypothetical protein KF873_18320 [Gemmataceae bacterium]|nr:hypothetical protein [Planctomycetia bacterium]MBX3400695.1 hypothetical protein [Gemmataceae bacterium]
MKPKKPRRFVPPLGGVSYQHIEMTKSISHYPITGKTTRLKWDRASGTLILDPDQPKEPTPGDSAITDGPTPTA